MFREVSKKKNEIGLDSAKQLLKQARFGTLSLNGDDGYPYGIPINYFYDDEKEKIYFHGARKGHKVDALNKSDKVCFTVCGPEVVKEEEWAPFVQSVVIFGRCHMLEDSAEALAVLKRFAMKYYPSEKLVLDEIKATGKAVQLLFPVDFASSG
jgi:nitroimidazol reductase NimA-like FMN-containing flavoprotein (pyridoxamine 5'-phosphate oxidase superfamily)